MALIALVVPRREASPTEPDELVGALQAEGVPTFALEGVPHKIALGWYELAAGALRAAPPGAWALCLHQDTFPDPGAVAALAEVAQEGPALLVMRGRQAGGRFPYDWWDSSPRGILPYDAPGSSPYPFTAGFALPLQVLLNALPLIPLEEAGWGAGANVALARAMTGLNIPIKLVSTAVYEVRSPTFPLKEAA